MKLSEMLEIQTNRENVMFFLSHQQQNRLSEILQDEVCRESFDELCNAVLLKYKQKRISNKQASDCFAILAQANKQFKIERYRYNDCTRELSYYCLKQMTYLFDCYCSKQEYNVRIKRDGRFID